LVKFVMFASNISVGGCWTVGLVGPGKRWRLGVGFWRCGAAIARQAFAGFVGQPRKLRVLAYRAAEVVPCIYLKHNCIAILFCDTCMNFAWSSDNA
jgi:hypothetical protein